jgi:hypothetical protein
VEETDVRESRCGAEKCEDHEHWRSHGWKDAGSSEMIKRRRRRRRGRRY